MGYGDNLLCLGYIRELFGDRFCRRSADAGVDFIKNIRIDFVCIGNARLYGEHQTAHLAAANHFAQRL